MSLQVWLPLNGDLTQQGLSGVEAVNNGATVDNEGKIGKCYNFDKTFLSFPNPLNNPCSEFSIAAWVNLTEGYAKNNGLHICSWNGTYSRICISKDGAAVRVLLASNGGVFSSTALDTSITANVWNHYTITFKNQQLNIYINGILDKSINTGLTEVTFASNTIFIGTYSSETSKGKVNDFRIYDHCLSAKEVKIISQGLILHYPLNREGFGQENLGVRTNQGTTGWSNSRANGTYSLESVKWLGVDAVKMNCEIASTGWKMFTHNGFIANWDKYKAGGTYTLSYDTSGEVPVTLSGLMNSDATNNVIQSQSLISNIILSNKQHYEYRIVLKDPLTKSNQLFYFANNLTANTSIKIANLKFEEGSIATQWCPASTDILAANLGLNNLIEYDTSGYCNNGKYYAYDENGSIEYTTDTPKYNVSTHIQSINTTTNTASGTRYLYGYCELINPTQITIAFWLKPITNGYGNSTNHGAFCTTNYTYGNINAGSDYQNSAMNHRDGSIDINDSSSTTQCRITCQPILGEWHHYAYTFDGQIGRSYKDGIQIHTAQFDSPKTLDSFIGVIIGFSKAGGVWRKSDSCYSDFRVYTTALSAEDIAELYSVGASIDNQGNVYSAMIQEV